MGVHKVVSNFGFKRQTTLIAHPGVKNCLYGTVLIHWRFIIKKYSYSKDVVPEEEKIKLSSLIGLCNIDMLH